MTIRTSCTPVLQNEGDPNLEFVTVSTSPPGGPIRTTTHVTIPEVGTFRLVGEGVYEHGLRIGAVPMKTPSGGLISVLRFLTIKPGDTSAPAITEVLYRCRHLSD